MNSLNYVLFAAFPYVTVIICVLGSIWRFRRDRFSFSSMSSQFLEDRQLFGGSIAWHYGIVIILLAHLIAFLFPGPWRWLISNINVLTTLEVIGLGLAVAAIAGLLVLIGRRLANARVRVTSNVMDWVLLALLLLQVVFGFWVALAYRWGADWFMHTSVPWIVSLLKLQPEITYVVNLPFWVQFHILLGFGIIGLFPFTRLVHVIAFPLSYLWRPLQVVIWNRRLPVSRSKV